MTYQINAWLERKEPELQVTLRNTGIVLLHWHAAQLQPMLETGLLNAEDFCDCRRSEQELVRELFLVACMAESRCPGCPGRTSH